MISQGQWLQPDLESNQNSFQGIVSLLWEELITMKVLRTLTVKFQAYCDHQCHLGGKEGVRCGSYHSSPQYPLIPRSFSLPVEHSPPTSPQHRGSETGLTRTTANRNVGRLAQTPG